MQIGEIIKDLKSIKPKNPKIRDWSRIWNPFMVKYDCQYVCELGVYKGDNFMEMIRHKPKLAVAVDSWSNEGVHTPKDASYTKDELESQYGYFKSLVRDLPFVQIIRDSTINASKSFPDNYFDFVYIDADHSAEACYLDIITWYPKVKPGKFLLGHDYPRYGVGFAVDKFVKDNHLELIPLFPTTWAVVKK